MSFRKPSPYTPKDYIDMFFGQFPKDIRSLGRSPWPGSLEGVCSHRGAPDQMKGFLHSLDHFRAVGQENEVDVELQNHPIMDGFSDKLVALRARKPGDPDPFVVGQENYSRFLEVMHQCVQVYIDRRRQ